MRKKSQRSKKQPRSARSVHTVEPTDLDTQKRSVGCLRRVKKPLRHARRLRREQLQGKQLVLGVANLTRALAVPERAPSEELNHRRNTDCR
jgi:hypothetical protein